MPRSSPTKAMLQQMIHDLEAERQQTQRALDALYQIGLACRSLSDPQELLATVCDQLATIWAFDACYIALCDATDKDHYRMALLQDEGEREFIERAGIGALTRHLLETRKPMVMHDLVVERTKFGLPPADPFGTDKPSRAWMGVPLMVGQDALGVISLQSYMPGVFDEYDIDLLGQIGAPMAVALENAALSHRQNQLSRSLAEQVALRNADLFVISDIAAMLTQRQALTEMFSTALDFLIDALGLAVGAICRVDEQHVLPIAVYGLPLSPLPRFYNDIPTIFEAVIDSGRTLLSSEPQAMGLATLPFIDETSEVVALPLLRANTVIGVLLVAWHTERRHRREEVELLQVVSNQLALALEQGIILEQRNRQIAELETMHLISQSAGRSLELSVLLRKVHNALDALMSIDVFYIIIYDHERGMVTDSMAIEADQEAQYKFDEAPPRKGAFSTWVIEHREPLFMNDVSEDMQHYPEMVRRVFIGKPVETWFGVPLLDSNEQVLGVISIQSYRKRAFSERDGRFLQAIASQVALHVRTMQLFRQRERQLTELNALQQISELISSTLDLEAMIMSIDQALSLFLGVDAFFVVLYNTELDYIDGVFALEKGKMMRFEEMVGQSLPSRTPTAWVIRHALPLRLNNLREETHDHPELEPVVVQEPGAVSWLGVPLLDRNGRPLGVLTIQGYESNQFSARDELFLLQVARQLTLAIQNARLFAERERQLAELDALKRITELVSSTLELDPMLRSIDVILREFLVANAFQVLIYDMERQRVEMAVISEEGVDVPTNLIGKPLPAGTFVGWTLANARPLRVGNVYTDWKYFKGLKQPPKFDKPHKPSWLSVPLLASEGQPLGVLAVRSYEEDAFTERDEQFLLNVGRQVGLSVRNARLFAAEQTAHRTADTLREIARVLNTSFNPNEVLSLILRELQHVIAYDSASVMLPSNNGLRTVARLGHDASDAGRWHELTFPIDMTNGAGRVMVLHEALIIEDTMQTDYWTPSPMPQMVRSWIGVPLISKSTVLGVLNINSLEPYTFAPSDVDIALAFANLAATALEHARLYQESVTRVEQELQIAHAIQSNLFPRELPTLPGFSLAGVCIPARETGGDFYDIQPLRNHQWALVVGDASGKSIPGAMLMAIARSVIRSEARDHETPQHVIAETNRWICIDVPAHSFVAVAYATINTVTRTLSLTNAGQLEPICLRADGALEYLQVPGPRLPLGINPAVDYQAATYALAAGDMVIFYTDGVVEAHNASGELWGFERLEAALKTHGPYLGPAALIDYILEEIHEFIGVYPQHDDITLVVLRTEEQ